MKLTSDESKVLTKVKGMLKTAFPGMQGWFKFHLAKEKPNADQVKCETHYTVENQ